ncbi:MAG: tRNA pseudouridine(55) synthase TruB [Bacteroidales bacterium]|nr:tRNA pseudouridine(55) synthase TruB [Bacteroidales bacterium]
MDKSELVQSFVDGTVLTFDKPLGWTSFDVVNKVRSMMRYVLGIKKLKTGHAGTLDPLATGLLIICTGKQTKSIERFQDMEKEYTGTFTIGQTTPSFDLETTPDGSFPVNHITREMVMAAAEKLSGHHDQVPPQFSAKKIEGERAYEFARRGEHTELKARKIVISEFEITRFETPEADFRVVCSKGTYIRSLARDFGRELHSGAHLKNLRRTRIGSFSTEGAWTIEDFEKHLRKIDDLGFRIDD